MSEERFQTELNQLMKLRRVLETDTILPLRFDIQRLKLNYRHFKVTIKGLTSLVLESGSARPGTASTFIINVQVPTGYPFHAIPKITFEHPIPFHPHIFTHGGICWGSGNNASPDLTLADWIRGVVEYLQYNQDQASMLRMNPASPANREAMGWWQSNGTRVSRYVPPINMARFRVWIDRTRG